MNCDNNHLRHASMGIVIVFIVGTLTACGDSSAPPTALPVAPQVTVERGVIALTPAVEQAAAAPDNPSEAGTNEAMPDQAGELVENPPDAAPDASNPGPALPAGAEVRARGQLRMYGTAQPTSPTLAAYQAGDLFIIMEPPGDVVVYPVELSGVRWYRVRATDGLVGWVIADGIELADAIEDAPVTD